jgi:transposase InsO family protein
VLSRDRRGRVLRRLLGWSITDHLRTQLCLDPLLAALAAQGGRHNLAGGIVFHTDHGTQAMHR